MSLFFDWIAVCLLTFLVFYKNYRSEELSFDLFENESKDDSGFIGLNLFIINLGYWACAKFYKFLTESLSSFWLNELDIS